MSKDDEATIEELLSVKRGFLQELNQGNTKFEKAIIVCERINTKVQLKAHKDLAEIKNTLYDIQQTLKDMRSSET